MAVYGDLVRYRELFANLFRRDFQAKYKGSLLGVVWSLLNPLVLLGVYLLVFGVVFPNQNIVHYPIYLLAGLACWIFFSVSLQSASRSMVDSAELIKKVRFPRQLVAFSMVATQAVTFAVMIVILDRPLDRVRPGGPLDRLGRHPARGRLRRARRRPLVARRVPRTSSSATSSTSSRPRSCRGSS